MQLSDFVPTAWLVKVTGAVILMPFSVQDVATLPVVVTTTVPVVAAGAVTTTVIVEVTVFPPSATLKL